MALYVNTNVSSLNGQRNLTNATNSLDTVYNANDGIAMAQTAEGAMDEITNMLQRIRTLSVQAANGTNTEADRDAIQQEVTQLSNEITRIACKTTFNGETILNGEDAGLLVNGKISFQVGANANDLMELDLSAGFTVSGISNMATLTVGTAVGLINDGGVRFSVSTADTAQATLANIDKMILAVDTKRAELGAANIDNMILAVDTKRAELGAIQNRMESTIRNQSNISQNTSDARSRIRDTDFAEESATLTQQSIIQQAASSMLMQANARPQLALSLLG